MNIDLNSLTLDEIEQVEDRIGQPIAAAFDAEAVSARTVRALVWVVKRREDPEITWEDVGSLRLSDVTVQAEQDPTSAAG